jgi:cell division protein FtsN
MKKTQQRGGTIVGLIMGLVIGLGVALAVAVYVTKVPVPFLTQQGERSADLDAAEANKNKDWDPNAMLHGRNPARTPAPAAVPALPEGAGGSAQGDPVQPLPQTPAAPARADAKPEAAAKGDPKAAADPLGDLVKSRAAASAADSAFNYFVQAGAFRSQGDADAQRAKLAMLGWEARVSEREQNGITIFRVRVGPFSKRDDAEQLKQKLDSASVESTLVRVAR